MKKIKVVHYTSHTIHISKPRIYKYMYKSFMSNKILYVGTLCVVNTSSSQLFYKAAYHVGDNKCS